MFGDHGADELFTDSVTVSFLPPAPYFLFP